MANNLYEQYGGNNFNANIQPNNNANHPNDGGFSEFVQQFQQFKSQFRGNPQEQIQCMLQSGQISQARLDQAQQLAWQFIRFWPR